MPLTKEVYRRFLFQIPTRLPFRQLCASVQATGWAGTWGRLIVIQSDHALEISVFKKLKYQAYYLIFNFICYDRLIICAWLPTPPTHTHTHTHHPHRLTSVCDRTITFPSRNAPQELLLWVQNRFPAPSAVSKALKVFKSRNKS
jgi:hypothetical protein